MATATLALLVIVAAGLEVAMTAPAGETTAAPPVEISTARHWHPEEPCSRQGGLCLLAEECPPGRLHNATGLCPEQQPSGVECCYGLSIKERRCSARGGICRSNHCGRQLWEEHADDCGPAEKCCILVR